jgi:hypothetical protein
MSDDDQPTVPYDTTPRDTLPLGQPQPEVASAPVPPASGPWATEAADPRGPRIRWAGVVWGALFCAFGIVVMSVLSTTANRIAFTSWVDGLGPGGGTLLGVAAVGALLVVLGVVAAAGRAQRRP